MRYIGFRFGQCNIGVRTRERDFRRRNLPGDNQAVPLNDVRISRFLIRQF